MDLDWIYDFWRQVSPYAYLRDEDQVLIIPPNLVYKTNATGAGLIRLVETGGRFEDLPGHNAERADQIHGFFSDIKAVSEGRPVGTASLPYDFTFTRLPVLGEIAVTYRCNNRCRFCYAGCGDAGSAEAGCAESGDPAGHGPCGQQSGLPGFAGAGDELDTAGFKRIIDIFKEEAKIPFFSFTGGEPLLRPDLEELIAYAYSRGLRVNLVSNGSLATVERAASLYAAGLRTAQISLEAPSAGLHDELCGHPGIFELSLTGIRNLMAAGISVQTNSTLTARNREALLDLPAFVAGLGLRRMAMNLFIPAGSGLTAQELLVPYSQVGSFIDAVRRKAREAGVEFFWYSPTPLCLYNPIARGLGNKSCAACDGLISVAPDGSILPCSSWPEPIGRLTESGFSELWFGERAQWFKHKHYAPPGCQSCSAFNACQAACPLYWRVCGYGELPQPAAAQGA